MSMLRYKTNGGAEAHRAVAFAIRNGQLPLASTLKCVDCGEQASDYDHRDYLKPLDVDAVCRTCNGKRGRALDGEDADAPFLFPKTGRAFILTKQGILPVAVEAFDFYPTKPPNSVIERAGQRATDKQGA